MTEAAAQAGAPSGAPVRLPAFAAIVRDRTTRAGQALADDMPAVAIDPSHARGKSKLTGTGTANAADAAVLDRAATPVADLEPLAA